MLQINWQTKSNLDTITTDEKYDFIFYVSYCASLPTLRCILPS